MNQKILGLLRSPRRLLGTAIVGVGVVLLVASTVGWWGQQHRTKLAQTTLPSVSSRASEAQDTPTEQQVESEATGSSNTQPSSTKPKKQNNVQASSTGGPAGPSVPSTITVSLNIDDTLHGTVTLPEGSNQCDILQQALDDGTLHSLEMRYSSQYKSYAVYVINGVGDNNNVWWTYKINGESPPLGCSNIEAHDGQSIKWEYQK